MAEGLGRLLADARVVPFPAAVADGYAAVRFVTAAVALVLTLISPPPGVAAHADEPYTVVIGDRVSPYEDVVPQGVVLVVLVRAASWLIRSHL